MIGILVPPEVDYGEFLIPKKGLSLKDCVDVFNEKYYTEAFRLALVD